MSRFHVPLTHLPLSSVDRLLNRPKAPMLMKLAFDLSVRSSASSASSGLGLRGVALDGNSVGRNTAGM